MYRSLILFIGLWLVVFGLFFQSKLYAQATKRLGVVEIEADTISNPDKQRILQSIRDNLKEQRLMVVVSDEEIESKLVQKSKNRNEFEKLRVDSQRRKNELERKVEEGKKFYLASQFEETIGALHSAFKSLKEIAAPASPQVTDEILKLTAASHYFLGNEDQAKVYLSAILDINPSAELSAEQFPPNFIQVFELLRQENRFAFKTWTFEGGGKDVKATIYGYPLNFEGGESSSVKLPLDHPIWGRASILLEKEGALPELFSLDQLPKEVRFQSMKDRRIATKGLFAPLGKETPPVELKKIMVLLNLSAVFLGSAVLDLKNQWIIKGQWLESSTNRVSPVITKADANYTQATREVVQELLTFISPEGRILNDRKILPSAGELNGEEVAIESSKPFYKTWWFWSLVGAGALGAGVGTYFAVTSQQDRLKVQVQRK
ncbi:MAG: hypothetical protein J0L93_04640 [Deltaproteobacteria bacterium]|nr:hypothetical protein [Deltaproteobacteria bacterium]